MSRRCWKYKILTIFCFASITIGVHNIAGDSNVLFCDKLANAKPSPLFSFDKLLRLQMFTFEFDEDIVMVADGIRYVLNAKDLALQNYESILIPINDIHKPWLSDQFKNPPDSIGKIASIVRLASDERLEMGHKIGTRDGGFVVLVSNMYIYAYSDDTTSDGTLIYSRPLLSMKREGTQFSIVHDQFGHVNSNAYVISRSPSDTGLLIYSLNLKLTQNAGKIESDCQVIVNSECMTKKKFFYIQRDQVPMMIRLVHPERGNAKIAQSVPLAQMPPIGFIYQGRLFLFDVGLGCVYIIENWNRLDLDRKFITGDNDIQLQRKNIPFERFFRCAKWPKDIELFSFLDKNRCETTMESSLVLLLKNYKSNDGNPVPINTEIDQNNISKSKFKSGGKTIAIFVATFFLVGIIVFAAILIRRKIMQTKQVSVKQIDFRRNRPEVMRSPRNRTPQRKPNHDYAKRQFDNSSFIDSTASFNTSTYVTPPVYPKKKNYGQKRINKHKIIGKRC